MNQSDKLIAWRRTIAHMHGRRKAEEFLGFLAESGKVLSAEISFYDSLPRLAHLIVPFLGDWMSIDLCSREGETANVAEKSRRELDEICVRQLRKAFRPQSKSTGASGAVVTDHPLCYPDENGTAKLPQPLVTAQEINSYLVVPLALPMRRIGTMTIVAMKQENEDANRMYGPSELALAEEVGRRVSLAIERSILYSGGAPLVNEMPLAGKGINGNYN